jgi:hypothetical protein
MSSVPHVARALRAVFKVQKFNVGGKAELGLKIRTREATRSPSLSSLILDSKRPVIRSARPEDYGE